MNPGGESKMPMTAWAVTDLPEPDSPRIARVSASFTVNETPLIAFATASRVRNSTRSSSTSSSSPSCGCQLPVVLSVSTAWVVVTISGPLSAQLGVESVAYAVAQHDERQHGQRQEDAREEQHMRRGADQPDTRGFGNLNAPGDGGRLQPDTEEGQCRLDRDVRAKVDR